ncbi:neutral/alkaline non-lysosomal ceramidase N-terminal domain-containing protein [Mucilaginibacter jinjuensis]|uniref:Neutral/alkaline non-lysosomal ceramidase N-terminal domain-containing protein n=1 Tax=Mucilaginibacter jinjuensis TaxID=1176721 RepID=A0ABY7T231_9SPHI|nr:neutral/alkaline non-lysosomal ceramidase N-terminal domain-containing protein [Mucilaginibacter jinjuensis]WCT10456.1 neutral/alkaline non-lysosomal ceramidase N-terminal domain-containing protein [Mucilaginibacter jinjuensis]
MCRKLLTITLRLFAILFVTSVSLCCVLDKAFAENGKLLAGTSKINITPKTNEPIHDSVYARSLVLDANGKRLAFVSVDLAIFTSDRLEKICKEKYGLTQLILCSSHTHSEPQVGNKMAFQGNPYNSFYEDQIIKVVGEAVNHLFEARIGAGQRSFPQLGFNRLIVREDGHAKQSWIGDAHYKVENPDRIPFGPVDPEVGVIKIEDMKGNTRALVMNYAMHADIVCFNYAISADYPGVASRKVEEAYNNKVNCLFIQGAGGNIEALQISPRRSGPNDAVQTNYAPMERTGELLAWEVLKLAKSITPLDGQTDIKYVTDSLQFTGRYHKSLKYDVHLSTLILNNQIAIAICPGELFVQFELEWKKHMQLADKKGFFFGYSWSGGNWPGYVADVRSAALGGYGADENDDLIEVGAGENIMTQQLKNYYNLTGLMRQEPPKQ